MNAIIFLFPVILIFAPALTTARTCRGTATYRVSLVGRWTANRFEVFDPTAHFAPLTAISHKSRYSAWTQFGYASEGIKNVAQLGDNTVLLRDLDVAKSDGFVRDVSGMPLGTIFNGNETGSVDVTVDCENSFISAIAMAAPSPDWFASIDRVNVVRRGRFIKKMTGKVFAHDAGTDDGVDFLPDTFVEVEEPTVPQENIIKIAGSPFFGKNVGFFKIERIA